MAVKKSETKIGKLKSQRKLRIMVSSAVPGGRKDDRIEGPNPTWGSRKLR